MLKKKRNAKWSAISFTANFDSTLSTFEYFGSYWRRIEDHYFPSAFASNFLLVSRYNFTILNEDALIPNHICNVANGNGDLNTV